jgi:hypothetical protein
MFYKIDPGMFKKLILAFKQSFDLINLSIRFTSGVSVVKRFFLPH